MRGNRVLRLPDGFIDRSIPAHAGQPSLPALSVRRGRVYPRACGATQKPQHRISMLGGLSPRMRGNLLDIPLWLHLAAVYPRACGATCTTHYKIYPINGLSPRMRGNLASLFVVPCLHRSIPAHAGQPSELVKQYEGKGVYPRACGATWSRCPTTSIR